MIANISDRHAEQRAPNFAALVRRHRFERGTDPLEHAVEPRELAATAVLEDDAGQRRMIGGLQHPYMLIILIRMSRVAAGLKGPF